MAKRQCKGTNASGGPCGATPLKGKPHCFAHDKESQESARFGGAQPGAGRPRVPRVTEVMREWVEEHAEQLLSAYVDGLDATLIDTVMIGDGESMRWETSYPDHDMRMKAAEKLQDRAVGKPRQRIEHAGSEDLAPISVEFSLDDKAREAIAGVLRRRPAARSE